MFNAQKWRDLAARAAWTGAQGAVSVVTVEVFDLPVELIPLGALGLSILKSWIATKVGNPNTVTFDERPVPELPLTDRHGGTLSRREPGPVPASGPPGSIPDHTLPPSARAHTGVDNPRRPPEPDDPFSPRFRGGN